MPAALAQRNCAGMPQFSSTVDTNVTDKIQQCTSQFICLPDYRSTYNEVTITISTFIQLEFLSHKSTSRRKFPIQIEKHT